MRWLLFAAVVIVTWAQPFSRCFLQSITMDRMDGEGESGVFYNATIDFLTTNPLYISFDVVAFGPVLEDNCASYDKSSFIQFYWSDSPQYYAPFASYPTFCGDSNILEFGISTIAVDAWGKLPRYVRNNKVFRPQFGRVSMLTGIFSNIQTVQRIRPLMVKMVSNRAFSRPLVVRSCLLATDVPYDIPAGAWEVTPPAIIPVAGCVNMLGGHCGANAGYVCNSPTPIVATFGTKRNMLRPASMQNGFNMPSVFTPGVYLPSSFDPPLHMSWACEPGVDPANAEWLIDGNALYFYANDWLCGMQNPPNTAGIQSITVHETAALPSRQITKYQDPGERIAPKLQAQVFEVKKYHIPYETAQRYWTQAGVGNPYMSVTAKNYYESINAQHSRK